MRKHAPVVVRPIMLISEESIFPEKYLDRLNSKVKDETETE